MLIDMHLHTTLSGDSFIAPEEMVECAKSAGLDGFCITDHNRRLENDLYQSIQDSTDLMVIPGAELWTDVGEILVYGVTDDDFWERFASGMAWPKIQPLVREINSLGGVIVVPHPFRKSSGLAGEIFSLEGIAALELNANDEPHQHEETISAAAELGLPLVGGSDAHQHRDVGRFATVFYKDVSSVGEFVQTLRLGEGFAPKY